MFDTSQVIVYKAKMRERKRDINLKYYVRKYEQRDNLYQVRLSATPCVSYKLRLVKSATAWYDIKMADLSKNLVE